MLGWELLTRPDHHILHYRLSSSAGGIWRGRFRMGLMDASFGSHPLFEFLKCCRRLTTRPVILGSCVRFFGFLWWKIAGRKPLLKSEEVAFLRNEQRAKMRRWIGFQASPSVRQPVRSLEVGQTQLDQHGTGNPGRVELQPDSAWVAGGVGLSDLVIAAALGGCPLLIMTCLIPLGQDLVLFELHLRFFRILSLIGMVPRRGQG